MVKDLVFGIVIGGVVLVMFGKVIIDMLLKIDVMKKWVNDLWFWQCQIGEMMCLQDEFCWLYLVGDSVVDGICCKFDSNLKLL